MSTKRIKTIAFKHTRMQGPLRQFVMSARAIAADFVTHRNAQMHYAAFQFCLQSQLQ